MYVVTVTFTLNPGQADSFLPLMRENARLSRRHEPGCRQFDICHDPDRPDEVFLYEVYDTAQAFAVHLQAEHFLAFDRAAAAMVAGKAVRSYRSHWA